MSRTRSFIVDATSNYLRMFATILGTVFLTRAMVTRWSVDDFGCWSLVTTVMSLALLLDLGLSNIVLKAAGDETNADTGTVLSSACMTLGFFSALACMVLSFATHWILPQGNNQFLVVIIALSLRATLASLPWTVCRSALYARGRMSISNLMQSIGILIYSASACLALHFGASLAEIAILSLAFTAIDSLLLYTLFRLYLPEVQLRPRFNAAALRPLLSLGGASLLINFAGFILLKTDPLIVRTFLPFAQVAMYAVALRIAENVFLLCKQLVNALTPHAIRAGLCGNTDHAARIFVRATRYVMALGAPIYVCALVLGRQGIRFWLSPAYESSAVILRILLLAMILSIPQLVGSNLLTFSGHHKKTALFISVGAIINVLASITFVKWTGVTGVAYGTLFTTLVIDVLIVVPFTCRVFNVNLLTFTFGIVRSVLVPAVMQWMTLRVLQLHFHTGTLFMVLLEGAASCAVFLFAFVLFGTIREERSAILQALVPVVGPLRRPLEAR